MEANLSGDYDNDSVMENTIDCNMHANDDVSTEQTMAGRLRGIVSTWIASIATYPNRPFGSATYPFMSHPMRTTHSSGVYLPFRQMIIYFLNDSIVAILRSAIAKHEPNMSKYNYRNRLMPDDYSLWWNIIER